MATQTGNSGTYNIYSENQYISGYVQWTETYDDATYITTNKTTITQRAYLHRTNIYSGETAVIEVPGERIMYFGESQVADSSNLNLSIAGTTTSGGGPYTEVYSASYEITHDADGSKLIELGFYMNNNYTGEGGNAFRVPKTTSNVTLMTIPRYANVTVTSSDVTERQVNVSWISDSAIDEVKSRIYLQGSTAPEWEVIETNIDKLSNQYTVTFPTTIPTGSTFTLDYSFKRKDSQLSTTETLTVTSLDSVVYIKVNDNWVKAIPYVNVNGEWKKADPYEKINGTWKYGRN